MIVALLQTYKPCSGNYIFWELKTEYPFIQVAVTSSRSCHSVQCACFLSVARKRRKCSK
uniref:Uncharacterized protein n=1 Tax=Setaria italica TaxID=4555 RepID=K3YKQ3_SETIT